MKQLMFSTFALLLVAQFFLGSTGVIVYEHHCKKDGTSRSLFIEQEHDRDAIKEVKSCSANSCCSSAEKVASNSSSFDKEVCCSNSIDYIQLDTDLALEKNELQFKGLVTMPTESANENPPAVLAETSSSYRGPPPSSISERLASLQTYII